MRGFIREPIMLRIGLTGGIGAGKSTVSATFADCGGVIVDGDVIARRWCSPAPRAWPRWSTSSATTSYCPMER